jgi:hypothetical protein
MRGFRGSGLLNLGRGEITRKSGNSGGPAVSECFGTQALSAASLQGLDQRFHRSLIAADFHQSVRSRHSGGQAAAQRLDERRYRSLVANPSECLRD